MNAHDVEVPQYFKDFIELSFGDAGREWLDAIPTRVAHYAAIWDLDILPPFAGLSYNYVTPARRRDGSAAVLKIGLPEPEQRSEIYALQAFAGRGITRLLEADPDEQVALIERLSPGVMLSTLYPDEDAKATEIGARVMRAVAMPAPDDRSNFVVLEDWFKRGLGGLRSEFDGGVGPFPEALVERTEGLFQELNGSVDSLSLIHGDLHHMNILSSDAHGGWLAIDPKGLIADRAYEPAPFILNPHDLGKLPNLNTTLERRIDQFAEILEIDRYRVHGWTLAFTVLSAWWSYGSNHDWQKTIALGEVLAELE